MCIILQATASVTVASVIVTAAGRGNTVTAASALRRACQAMAPSAAAEGSVSAAGASAPYPELLGTSVRSVRRAETPVALQGENSFIALARLRV